MFSTKAIYFGAASLLALCLVSGCGPAEFLNPLFEESEKIILPGLAGNWAEEGSEKPGEEVLLFEEKEGRGYRFRIGIENGSYEGFAGMIGPDCYFEIIPEISIRHGGQFKVLLPSGEGIRGSSATTVPIADGLCLVFGKRSSSLAQAEEIEFKVLPTRMILQLRIAGDHLDIWYLDSKDLKERLDEGELLLPHSTEPGFVVSASSQELRDFLQQYNQDTAPGLFTKLGTYRRSIPGEQPKL